MSPFRGGERSAGTWHARTGTFMEQLQDYYRILGVSRDVPERDIKRAYYELARKLHPDKAATPEEGAKNANDLAVISQAYNVLKDKKKRAEYDVQLRGRAGASAPAAAAPSPAAAPEARASAPAAAQGVQASSDVPDSQVPAARSVDVMAQKKSMAQKAFVRGMQVFKTGEYRQALSFFEVAIANDPEAEAQYHLKYAQCIIKSKGSFTKALQAAEKACQMEPFNVEFKLVLGHVYEAAGVVSKAKEIYEDALRWDGANEQAKLRLAMLGGKGGKSSLMDKLNGLFKKK